jgi:hypothetical protein
MKTIGLDEARAAKGIFARQTSVVGLGLTRVGDGYGVKINLDGPRCRCKPPHDDRRRSHPHPDGRSDPQAFIATPVPSGSDRCGPHSWL